MSQQNLSQTIFNAGQSILNAGHDAIQYIIKINLVSGNAVLVLGVLMGGGMIINKINVQPIPGSPIVTTSPSTPSIAPMPEPETAQPSPATPDISDQARNTQPIINNLDKASQTAPLVTPITVRNTSTQIGTSEWNWTAYVESDSQTLSQIDCVEYTLHPTFPNPIRQVCTSQNNFALSARGWGAFYIKVRVFLKDGTVRDLSPYLLQGVGV
ncbi:pYEATS domain-containing protein [Planktothrix pseudagardhii]|nr:pYEATS domain-containing protein [Planktothrix pseudagardhii]